MQSARSLHNIWLMPQVRRRKESCGRKRSVVAASKRADPLCHSRGPALKLRSASSLRRELLSCKERPEMRLTQYTDYALRVLLYLAIRPSCLSTIEEIASAYGISKSHLTKVVNQLSELGWVETVRGRNGGLRLSKNSGGLTIGAVVRNTENAFALAQCFTSGSGSKVCAIEPRCSLKHVFAAARDAFLAELDKYSVAGLAQPANELASLLNITSSAPIKPYAIVRNDTIA